MRALNHALAAAGLLALVAPSHARAQTSPAQLLQSFKPMQKDLVVDYDTPTDKAEIDACKVESQSDKKTGTFAYLLRDGQGRLLRRFADTNGKKDAKGQPHLDQWSYFKDGFEVYREIDLDEDGVLDECRWLNGGGTRIALIKSNRIAAWKRISAEEASKVLVQALVAGNAALVETVMATPEDLNALGVPASEVEKVTKARADRAAALEALRKQLKGWNAQTTWARFDGTLPHVIPADAGLKDDLTLYENAFIFVNPPSGQDDPLDLAYLQAIEIVRIGEAWKFIEVPRVIDPKSTVTASVDAGIRAALYQADGSGAEGGNVDPAMEEALKVLAAHDQKAPPAEASKQDLAKFHVERVNLLFKVIKVAPASEQLNFTKQAVDSLAAAYQTGLYEAASERLDQYASQEGPIAPYAAYRKVLAEYSLEADQPGSDYIKVQKAFLEKLAKFIDRFPTSEETPDVLFQLASINEFNAEEDAARTYYQRLVKDFPDKPVGKKAVGALKRLDLVGKTIELSGAGTGGKAVNADEFRGKTLLITFWTTAADPVRRDLPELLKVYQKYQPKGFAVLGVNLDADRATLDAFLKETPLPWPLIHEPGGMDSRLADEYGIISLPTMILVDAEGKVLNRNIRTSGELERFLDKLLTSTEAARRPAGETR